MNEIEKNTTGPSWSMIEKWGKVSFEKVIFKASSE